MLWRRGFPVRPPLGDPDDDPRYAALPPDARPRGESLHDVVVRLLPYWYDMIVPDLYLHGCVLVVSHGNTLRALVKHLKAVSDEAASGLEVANAVPLCYEFEPAGARDPAHGLNSLVRRSSPWRRTRRSSRFSRRRARRYG
jgi:2,3-bisphosphoglycerate-dependent phosphoglycerate mutase